MSSIHHLYNNPFCTINMFRCFNLNHFVRVELSGNVILVFRMCWKCYMLPQIILPIISMLFCISYPYLKTSRIIILRQQEFYVFQYTLKLELQMITLQHKTKWMIDSTKTNQCCDYRLTDAVSVITSWKNPQNVSQRRTIL